VVGDLEAQARRDLVLPFLDAHVRELLHPAAVRAHDVVVVLTLVQFEDGGAALEVVTCDQPGGLELGEHAVHGRQPDVLVGLEQAPVDILGAQVAGLAGRQDVEDLEPRYGDLQAGTAQL